MGVRSEWKGVVDEDWTLRVKLPVKINFSEECMIRLVLMTWI